MMMKMEKDRCPICWSFGTSTRHKNIFICHSCEMPFNEFGVSPIISAEIDFHYVLN